MGSAYEEPRILHVISVSAGELCKWGVAPRATVPLWMCVKSRNIENLIEPKKKFEAGSPRLIIDFCRAGIFVMIADLPSIVTLSMNIGLKRDPIFDIWT